MTTEEQLDMLWQRMTEMMERQITAQELAALNTKTINLAHGRNRALTTALTSVIAAFSDKALLRSIMTRSARDASLGFASLGAQDSPGDPVLEVLEQAQGAFDAQYAELMRALGEA